MITSAQGGVQYIAMQSSRLSVCLSAHISEIMSNLHAIFFTSYMWPWLGHDNSTIHYVLPVLWITGYFHIVQHTHVWSGLWPIDVSQREATQRRAFEVALRADQSLLDKLCSFCYSNWRCLLPTYTMVIWHHVIVKYRISSNRSWALNTSRASNTGRGFNVVILIEAGPWIQAGSWI